MTNRPRLTDEANFVAGLAAVALFLVLGAVFLGVSFPGQVGFPQGAAVTKSLGAAMFNIAPSALMGEGEAAVPGEGFLVAFEIIDVVLVAALVGAVMLARREESGESVSVGASDPDDAAVAADGGPPVDDEQGGDDA